MPSSEDTTGTVDPRAVRLTKEQAQVSLRPGKGANGQLRVTLTWHRGSHREALRGGGHVDLDLGCLWELRDGTKGCIQSSGKRFGTLTDRPWIRLDSKATRRAGIGRRSLTIDLDRLAEFKRILLFTYIETGAPEWERAQPVLTFYPQGTVPIDIWIDETSPSALCAIAVLSCELDSVELGREVNVVPGGLKQLDKAYSWGMKWVLDTGPTTM